MQKIARFSTANFYGFKLQLQKMSANKSFQQGGPWIPGFQNSQEMKPNLTAVILIKFHFIHFSWNYFLCVCRVVFEIIFFISISSKNHFSRIFLWSSEKIKLPKNARIISSSFFLKLHTSFFAHWLYLSNNRTSSSSFCFNYWNNLF